MKNELLIQLLDEYKRLLLKELTYQNQIDGNIADRPTKAELQRLGILIREKSIEAEKHHDKNYWRAF